MKQCNVNEIKDFAPIEIFGIPALFTERKIDRATLPEGVFAYDIRGDGGNNDFATIELRVTVNRTGTIVTVKPINMLKGEKYRNIVEDYNFTDGECTLEEWLKYNRDKKAEDKELFVFLFPINDYDREATDEEIIAGYESGESDVTRYSLDEFAAMYNNEECGCYSNWIRFIKY